MRFHSKPYFVLGALLIAAAAPSQSGSAGPGQDQTDGYPAAHISGAASGEDATSGRVQEGSERRARYEPNASPQSAASASGKGTAMQDPSLDPFVQQVWSAP